LIKRALITLLSLTLSLQWLVTPAFAEDASQGVSPNQSQAADPIVQAQWSALVEAANNAQKGSSTGGLSGSASYDSSLLVPQPPTSNGVDIINESMKYHNSAAMQPFNNQMNGGMLGNYGQMQNGAGQINFNAYGMQNGINSMNSSNGMNAMGMNGMGMSGMNNGMMNNGMSNNPMRGAGNFVMPAGGNPMAMQGQMMNGCPTCIHQSHCCGHGNGMNSGMMNSGMMNNGMMNNGMSNGSQDGINTQALGVMGAATLMGVFMQKGGVGGILQDMNWDGSRHVRGSSIGGY
jgi:hypothetical protein